MGSRKNSKRSVVIFLCVALLWQYDASASVNLKNGNFFMSYIDVAYSGGPKSLNLKRVYNSMTSFQGMFGHGWGNEYEVFLTIAGDGAIVVHEYGGGAENRFIPVKEDKNASAKTSEQLLKIAQKSGLLGSQEAIAVYKKRLQDPAVRNSEWEKFVALGKASPQVLPVGTQWHSLRFNYQYITRTKTGYVRNSDSGTTEEFSNEGKLIRISDQNNNYLTFKYGAQGRLSRISDNFKRSLDLRYQESGLLAQVIGPNQKTAEYRYDALSQLIWSRDAAGNVYTYTYDTQNLHNLTKIGYSDGTTLKVDYYGPEKSGRVKQVIDREGVVSAYDYEDTAGDPKRTKITLIMKDPSGKVFSKNEYEYFEKLKADGETWTQELRTQLDGKQVRTVYDELCGLPRSIESETEQTEFVFDGKCHVTQKTSANEIVELHYDPKVGKVDRETHYLPKDRKVLSWSAFTYDPVKGNLSFAKNSVGQSVQLAYDLQGRIAAMVDEKHQKIQIKYNEDSKPIEITDAALGSMRIFYDNAGEVKDVKSPAGADMAMKVSAQFQKLLDIVEPAGVALSL